MGGGHSCLLAVVCLVLAQQVGRAALDETLDLPDWLSLSGSYRLRYESLDQPFRRTATGSDQLLAQRLLLKVEARGDALLGGVELQDSRAWLDDTGTPIGTDDVNTLEPLQAYVGWVGDGVLREGDTLQLAAGRLTIDAGARRLVARNSFRNTINAFTGLHGQWQLDGGSRVQAFVTLPVRRRPVLPSRLRDNDHELDDETTDDVFWGVFAGHDALAGGLVGEAYLLGLHESDLLDRDLYTLGGRIARMAAPEAWDFEVDVALQTGESQDLPSGVTARQDHRAGFAHLELGRTLNAAAAPRLVLQLDYASGDRDPDDDENNRFDTLFGARRFDFGPTGIYGALARSNLLSPGLRVEFRPGADSRAFVGYRAAFLASKQDLLATALLRDADGSSGRFVGQQLEASWRYTPRGGALQLETGGAYLLHERFLEEAPGAVNEGNTIYAYLQATWSF